MKKIYIFMIVGLASIATIAAVVISAVGKSEQKPANTDIVLTSDNASDVEEGDSLTPELEKKLRDLEATVEGDGDVTLPVYCYYVDKYFDYTALKQGNIALYEYNQGMNATMAADCDYVINNATSEQIAELKEKGLLSSDRRAILEVMKLLPDGARKLTSEDVEAAFDRFNAIVTDGNEVTAIVLAQMLDEIAGAPDSIAMLNSGMIVFKYNVDDTDTRYVEIMVMPAPDDAWYVGWNGTTIEYINQDEKYALQYDGTIYRW